MEAALAHAWAGYKEFAWGKDVLTPLTKEGRWDRELCRPPQQLQLRGKCRGLKCTLTLKIRTLQMPPIGWRPAGAPGSRKHAMCTHH